MKTTKRTEKYEIVAGTRVSPGVVLATFQGEYKCGGPATACLREFDRMMRRAPITAFFRKVA